MLFHSIILNINPIVNGYPLWTFILFSILYSPMLYLLLKRCDLIVWIIVGSVLSLFLFMVVFLLFTIVWIFFGLICLGYAFLTGLFKKQGHVVKSENASQASINYKKRFIIGVAIFLPFFYGVFHVLLYGFGFDRCSFWEKELSISKQLKNYSIILEKTCMS